MLGRTQNWKIHVRNFGKGVYAAAPLKGLEMNRISALGKPRILKTEPLIRVTIDDLACAERRVNVLMGDKVPPRRKWIEDNVKFTLEEATVSSNIV